MISIKEMLGYTAISDVPMTHIHNMEMLLKKVNVLREAWGKPLTVTSGYRTLAEHLRIYSQKGISQDKIPMGSQHLIGAAIDLYDPYLAFTKWLKENDSARLQALDLYCEEGNLNWTHIQLYPPKSHSRWFLP
jgi:hypothetical protein